MEKVSYLEYEVKEDEVKKLEIEDESARKEISSMKAKLDGLQEDVENCDICGIATGNTVNITDSAEAPFEELTLYGESKQLQPTGKNFFGFGKSAIDVTEELRKLENQRLIFTKINDNSIKCNYSWGTYATGFVELNGVDGTKDYAFSFDVKDNTLGFTPRIEKYTKECTSEKLVLSIYSGSGETTVSGNEYFILENIQVEEGTTATSYEPYTSGMAAPNPDYPQEIESKVVSSVDVSNAQILDLKANTDAATTNGFSVTAESGYILTVKGTSSKAWSNLTQFVERSLSKGKYTFSIDKTPKELGLNGIGIKFRKSIEDSTNFTHLITGSNKSITFDYSSEDFGMIQVYADGCDASKTYNFTIKVMLNAGETALPFEQHQSQTVNLSEAIELNGIGDVKDYIDVGRGVIVRKVYKKVFDGTEEIRAHKTTVEGYIFSYVDSDIKYNIGETKVTNGYCNYLKPVSPSTNWATTDTSFAIGIRDQQLRMRFGNDYTDAEQVKTWMAEKYAEGNPFTICVEFATPKKTALPQADIDAIKALHSYNPNTIIQNNADAEMKVQYFKNTENGAVTGSLREDVNNLNKKSAEALVHDDVVDDLSSEDADLPLSANQGRALNEKIDSIFSFIDEDSLMLDSNEFSGPIVDKELGTFTADREGIYHFYGSMRIYGTSSEYQSGQIYLEIEYDSPSMYRIIKTGCKLCEGKAGSDYPNELELIPLDTTLYLKEDEKVLFTLKTQTPYEDDLYIEDDVHVFCRYKSAE